MSAILSFALVVSFVTLGANSNPDTRALFEWSSNILDQAISLYNTREYHLAVRYLQMLCRLHAPGSDYSGKVNLIAKLYLGNALNGMGYSHNAAIVYHSALKSPSATATNTVGNVCRENLAHLLQHGEEKTPSESKATRQTTGKKYLAFRFWAGLSNRRQELLGMVGAAKILNRTLVLPPFVEGRWMANHAFDRPRQDVADFFDLEALRKFIDVISEAEFQSVARKLPPLSAELHVRDYAYVGQLAHLRVSWRAIIHIEPDLVQQPRTPERLASDLASTQAAVLGIDFSYRLIDYGVAGEFEYFNGTAEWTPARVRPVFQPSHFLKQVSYLQTPSECI